MPKRFATMLAVLITLACLPAAAHLRTIATLHSRSSIRFRHCAV